MPTAEYRHNYRARKKLDPKWVEQRLQYNAYIKKKRIEDPIWYAERKKKKRQSYYKHRILKPLKKLTVEEKAEKQKNRYQKIKKEAMDAYGGRCACCGAMDLAVLSINHINNGRPEGLKKHGTNLYVYLKRNNYPIGYNVLCLNCNWALGRYGYCPHNGRPMLKLNRYSNYYRQSKRETLKAYGEKCVVCGEKEWEFLQIDHIAEDGVKHRAILDKRFYTWLRDNNYPKDNFQILCESCNWSKHVKNGK